LAQIEAVRRLAWLHDAIPAFCHSPSYPLSGIFFSSAKTKGAKAASGPGGAWKDKEVMRANHPLAVQMCERPNRQNEALFFFRTSKPFFLSRATRLFSSRSAPHKEFLAAIA